MRAKPTIQWWTKVSHCAMRCLSKRNSLLTRASSRYRASRTSRYAICQCCTIQIDLRLFSKPSQNKYTSLIHNQWSQIRGRLRLDGSVMRKWRRATAPRGSKTTSYSTFSSQNIEPKIRKLLMNWSIWNCWMRNQCRFFWILVISRSLRNIR